MLCTVCNQNEATVHLTQVAGDKLQKIDICEQCAKEKGVTDATGYALAELLLGLSGAKEEAEEEQTPVRSQLRCPSCGFSQTDFKKTGRLGCPDCYSTFAEPLSGLLKNMHRGVRHVGKAPRALHETKDQSFRLADLQKQLDQAIADEDFERAALLRDEIKEVKAKLSGLAASQR